MVVYESTALGTHEAQRVAVARDPATGARAVTPGTVVLPLSLTLAPGAKHQPMREAIACGAAVAGLPDAVADDPEAKRLGLIAEKETSL